MSCTGIRDSTTDTVRPLPMCQTCAHWQGLTAAVVIPHAVCRMADTGMVLICTRRIAVTPLPEVD